MRAKWSLFLLLCLCSALILTSCTSPLSTNPSSQPTKSQQQLSQADIDATATQTALNNKLAKIKEVMGTMTLDQKIGQLIMVEFVGADYQAGGLQEMISQQLVGGYLYQPVNGNFKYPNNTIEAAKAFADQAQKEAKIPLLVAIDQEGGQVAKIYDFFGESPSARDLALSGNTETALKQGATTANWMSQLGINTNLAPVVDVETASPPLLQDRTFGQDPNTVATYAGAFLDGLQQNKTIGTLKHFPGLGSFTSDQDPHEGLFTTDRSLEDLYKYDIAPFKQLIAKNNPAMIMTTNSVMSAIDPDLPAELSPKTVDGILRKELGYQGVIITDGLYMRGIADRWSIGEASVLAIIAGNDIIEGPTNPTQVAEVISSFKEAVQTGRLTEKRIDESVQRILLMKQKYNILP